MIDRSRGSWRTERLSSPYEMVILVVLMNNLDFWKISLKQEKIIAREAEMVLTPSKCVSGL